MKSKSIASALIALSFAGSAFAAGSTGSTSTSTSNISNLYQKLKESPASLSVLLDTGFAKNEHNEIVGATQTNIAYLGWKLSPKDKIQLENRWTTDFGWDDTKTDEENKAKTTWAREVLKYTRSSILTQDKHGMNLAANAELRILPDTESKASANSNGLARLSLSGSRSLNNGISLSGTLYGARNLVKNTDNEGTYTTYLYLVTTQSYGITDKLSVALTEEFYRNSKPGTANDPTIHNTEDLTVTAEVGYQFNPVVYAGVYAGNSIMGNRDGRLFKEEIFPNANWGVNFYISAF